MEKQIFKWQDWDDIDVGVFNFYECELIINVGEFVTGTKIRTITVDFQKGKMEFYFDESGVPTKTFDLLLSVVN